MPILHLASLHDSIPAAKDIWDDPPKDLDQRLDVKRRFLRILQKSGEGKVTEVFKEASALFQDPKSGDSTLAGRGISSDNLNRSVA